MSETDLTILITASDSASEVLRNIGENASGLGNILGDVLKVGFVAAAAGVAAFGAATVVAIKEASESEDVLAKFNATLQATGGVSGITTDAAVELSQSLQKVTRYSDETVLSAEGVLLRFKEIGQNTFPEATRISLDLASALGIDATSAATMLGKALEDPGVGLLRLKAAGVAFSADQIKVIKDLGDTGHAAQAQKMILDELTKTVGGTAEAMGKTFSGQMAILDNLFKDSMETIGKAFLPMLKDLATFVKTNLLPAFENFATDAAPKIEAALKNIMTQIKPFLTDLAVAIKTGDFSKIPQDLGDILMKIWDFVRPALVDLLGKVAAWAQDKETVKAFKSIGGAISGAIIGGIKDSITSIDWKKFFADNSQTFMNIATGNSTQLSMHLAGIPGYQTEPGETRMIPGPANQPYPILAHGGEVIGRPGAASSDYVVVSFNRSAFQSFMQPFIESGVLTMRSSQIGATR